MELDRRSSHARRSALVAYGATGVVPLFAFLFALLPAAAIAFQQPLWSRVDEAQHFDFIAQLANGSYPLADRTMLRPETVRIMDRTGIYRWFQPNDDAQPSETDPRTFRMPPPGLRGQARSQWYWRHIWTFSYESFQPPLYYALMVPVYLAGSAAGGPATAVYLLRLVNALLAAALAPIAWLIAREVLPERRWSARAAPAAAVAVPGMVVNLTQITNDTLAAAVGGVVIALSVRWCRRGFTPGRAAALGALLGAAALTKLTVLGLIPAVALAFILARQLRLGALAAGVAGLVLAPWVLVNEHLYHRTLPPHNFMSFVFTAPPLSARLLHGDAWHALLTYFAGEPVGVVPLTDTVMEYATFMILAACLGLALLPLARRPFVPGTLLLLATAVAGMTALAVVMPVFSQIGGLTPGRYMYPAAPAVGVLLAAGIWSLLPIPPTRAALVICMVGVAAASLSAFAHGYTGDRAILGKHYSPPPSTGVPVNIHGTFGDVSVRVDRFVDDSANGDVWMHVIVDNPTSHSIEWWPRPDVQLDGGQLNRTDYGRSQRVPETVEPGQHVDAWVVAPVAQTGPFQRLDVVFEAIAAYDYSVYGNLRMESSIPPYR